MATLAENYDYIVTQKVNYIDFYKIFGDDSECLQLLFNVKYADYPCGCGRLITENYVRIKRVDKNGVQKKAFRCRSCHNYIYPLSGTIFRNSHIPISLIFQVLFLFSASKKTYSATDIVSHTGISYKKAHRLMMLIRSTLHNPIRKLRGTIEIDEVFIGAGGKRMWNWSGISTRKQPIIGMMERGTMQAKVFLVNNRSSKTIIKLIENNVEAGSTIYTDSWSGYNNVSQCLTMSYIHESVNHAHREFVRGDAHTNTIEAMWGYFKKSLRGANIHITEKYVGLYINELCWRHNNKSETAMKRFDTILRGAIGVGTRSSVLQAPNL